MHDTQRIAAPAIRAAALTLLLAAIALPGAADATEPTAFPEALTRFVPYGQNPVFAGAGGAEWDATIRERGWILRENGLYRMWYTGYDGTDQGMKMLGYATSFDGLHWTRHPHNPIYREDWVEDMMVVRHGDVYYMFAEGYQDRAQLLTSADGLHWERVGQLDIRRGDGRPIPPGPFGTPTAWYQDGVWRLYYERGDQGVWLATSADMKVWTNVQEAPVISPGPGAYDKTMIALNQIVQYGGKYYALYHGSGDPPGRRRWCTCLAASDDLVHWTKYPQNPLLPLEMNKSSGILVQAPEGLRLYTMHDRVDVHMPMGQN